MLPYVRVQSVTIPNFEKSMCICMYVCNSECATTVAVGLSIVIKQYKLCVTLLLCHHDLHSCISNGNH